MFRRGRRLSSAASIGLLLVALAHTLGNVSTTPSNETEAAVIRAMSEYRLALGIGMTPSLWDITRSLSFTMSLTLAVWGAHNLLVARYASDQLVRSLTIMNVIGVGALVALFGYYRIPPPLVTLAVVELLFVAALLRKGSDNQAG